MKKHEYRIGTNDLIGESYKAVKEFLNWVKDNESISEYHSDYVENEFVLGGLVWSDEPKWYLLRGLMYDFFDENYLFIDISLEVQYTRETDEDGNNPHYHPDGFRYDIHDLNLEVTADGVFKTRTEAEHKAFKTTFEILQNKLK